MCFLQRKVNGGEVEECNLILRERFFISNFRMEVEVR